MKHELVPIRGFGYIKVYETGTVIVADSDGNKSTFSVGMLKRLADEADKALIRVINDFPITNEASQS